VILYLHGFNSSPASGKARGLEAALAERGLADQFRCPALHHEPSRAIAQAEALIASAGDEPVTLVGSSLGGFYATWLAERHDLRAVLLNPAVVPMGTLEHFLGWQQNLYTGERYELTPTHIAQMRALSLPSIDPRRYLLIVETGDEVLDYREALARYAGAETVVVEGGNHTLESYPQQLPRILAFARIGAAG
jgi:predicted esterase YcpF (UPF0227 family)